MADDGPPTSDDREPLPVHIVLLVAVSGVLLSSTAAALLRRGGHTWLPPSAVSVACGLAVGTLIRLRYSAAANGVPYELGFDGPIFFLLLLPIINFDSGLSLRRGPFFAQLFSILSFSILGTLLSALLIGVAIHSAGAAGVSIPLSFEESMALASILAATDGLTLGGILSDLEAPPGLVALVLGEGSANDAVSIVLYNTFVGFMDRAASGDAVAEPKETAGEAMARFVSILTGSVGVGVGLSVLSTLAYRVLYLGYTPEWVDRALRWAAAAGAECCCCCHGAGRRREAARRLAERTPLMVAGVPIGVGRGGGGGAAQASSSSSSAAETATAVTSTTNAAQAAKAAPLDVASAPGFLILVGYTSYMAAESLSMSGVVAVLFCGIGLNFFHLPILPPPARAFALQTSRIVAQIADTAVFFQVGLDIALTLGTVNGIDRAEDVGTLLVAMGAVLAARALAIFPLALGVNYLRRKPIPLGWQAMLWHSGMRGAGAYAFALVWPSENRELIVDITAGVVLLTVLVLGATTVPMMRWTGTTGAQEKERERARAAAEAVLTAAQQQQPGGGGGGGGMGAPPFSSPAGRNYKTAMVKEARVYIPLSRPSVTSRAYDALSSAGSTLRLWVSGVRPRDGRLVAAARRRRRAAAAAAAEAQAQAEAAGREPEVAAVAAAAAAAATWEADDAGKGEDEDDWEEEEDGE
jgi:NhaP-type Na+/H+ or K+/H+ antiporter